MLEEIVKYRLEIMAPGKSAGEPLASISSDTPFMKFGRGELIETGMLDDESSGEFLKVLHQVHSFAKLEGGETVQKIIVFTSKVYDCASVRSEWVRGRV